MYVVSRLVVARTQTFAVVAVVDAHDVAMVGAIAVAAAMSLSQS